MLPIKETEYQDERLYQAFQDLPGHHHEENGASEYHQGEHGYIGWDAGYTYHEGSGWETNQVFEEWSHFWGLDSDPDLNLVADYYFDLTFDTENCPSCEGTGQNPETARIGRDFYDFEGKGTRWVDDITEGELQALKDKGRIPEEATVEEVNEANTTGSGWNPLSHDAINRWTLVETRAKRLGVYGHCDTCEGVGYLRRGPDRIALHLWMLHPRKMASKGIIIQSVDPREFPTVKKFLRKSKDLHDRHFEWAEDTNE